RAAGRQAIRIDPGPLRKAAEAFMDATFGTVARNKEGKGGWIEASTSNMIYFNRKLLADRNVKQTDAEAALPPSLASQTGRQPPYPRTSLTAGSPAPDPLPEQVLAQFPPERSGDVTIVVKPYCLLLDKLAGTTHGGPHAYDPHVPLVVFGPGVRAGSR